MPELPRLTTGLAVALALALAAHSTAQAPAAGTTSTRSQSAEDGEERQSTAAAPGAGQLGVRTRDTIAAHKPKANAAGFIGDPYPLDVCIVSGEKLGPDAITVVLEDMVNPTQDGRQVRFCCPKCEAEFRRNPVEYVGKLDKAIIDATPARAYPLDHCIVMLDEQLDDSAKVIVYGNRLYRLCCKKCITNFTKNLARYTSSYEKELEARQRPSYPLTTCVVSGEPLGDRPYDFVIGSRLVRTCCDTCAAKVLKDPATYLAKIDAAKANAEKGAEKPAAGSASAATN